MVCCRLDYSDARRRNLTLMTVDWYTRRKIISAADMDATRSAGDPAAASMLLCPSPATHAMMGSTIQTACCVGIADGSQ